MYHYISKAVVGLAVSHLASAQLYSECNPTERDDCAPNPAVGDNTIVVDFTQGESDHFTVLDGTPITYDSTKGAVLSCNTENDSPTMVSNQYIFYGRVDVIFQAAPGGGIVTAITLQSEDLDEIDIEWVGYDHTKVQSNYFSAGITGDYDRGEFHDVSGDAMTEEHKYSLVWMPDKLEWLVDDVVVRTLIRDDNVEAAYRYPQTPSRIRLGIWVAGKEGQSAGTIEWAGGMVNWDNKPFEAYLKSVTYEDYANGVSNAKEYVWTDRSGLDSSIKVVTYDEADADADAGTDATTSSAVDNSTTTASTDEPAATTDEEATATDLDETLTTDEAAVETGNAETSATCTDEAEATPTDNADGEDDGEEDCDDDEDAGEDEDGEDENSGSGHSGYGKGKGKGKGSHGSSDSGYDYEHCDCEDDEITSEVNNGAVPTTLVSAIKSSGTATTTAVTPTQTGWKPKKANGVGFVPACEGDLDEDEIVASPTTETSSPTSSIGPIETEESSPEGGFGSESDFDSEPSSGLGSAAPTGSAPVVGGSNGTVTNSPEPTGSTVVFDGAASGLKSTGLAAFVVMVGTVLML